jgi:hypothetical protein
MVTLLEGLPLSVWLLIAGGGILMLCTSIVSPRGRLITHSTSLLLNMFAALSAPTVTNSGEYYTGMIFMQYIFGTLAFISILGLIATAMNMAKRRGGEEW